MESVEKWLDQTDFTDEKGMKKSLYYNLVPHLSKMNEDMCYEAANMISISTQIPASKIIEEVAKRRKPSNVIKIQSRINAQGQPKIISATGLLDMNIPEPLWIVPGLVAEGVTLLVGKPKMGKSWLCLGLAISVAFGGIALSSISVNPSEVLYISLEDNWRRLKSRLAKMLETEEGDVPKNLCFATDWRKSNEGGIEDIKKYIEAHPDCKLIIIDTFSKFRSNTSTGNVYADDYGAIGPIKKLADEKSVAIILVHHTRKAGSGDVFDEVSGSNGITGAVDTTLILKRERGQADAVLYVTGRDVEEQEKALSFNAEICQWRIEGEAVAFQTTKLGVDIQNILKSTSAEIHINEIVEKTSSSIGYVKKTLTELVNQKLINRKGKGFYQCISFDQVIADNQKNQQTFRQSEVFTNEKV